MARRKGGTSLSSEEVSAEIDSYGARISFFGQKGGPNLLAENSWPTPPAPGKTHGYGSSLADFHAEYRGGWHLLFPNAGYESEVLGVVLPFHGEVARQIWDVHSTSKSSVTLSTVSRLPLRVTRTVSLSGRTIRVEDFVENVSPLVVPFTLGHHPVFPLNDQLLLDLPQGKLVEVSSTGELANKATLFYEGEGPVKHAVSNLRNPSSGLYSVSLFSPGWFALRGIHGHHGVAVAWDVKQLPNLWLWIENQSTGFPWFGRAQYLGVEPHRSSSPAGLAQSIESGEHLQLAPDETMTFWMEMSLLEGISRPVRAVYEGQGPAW